MNLIQIETFTFWRHNASGDILEINALIGAETVELKTESGKCFRRSREQVSALYTETDLTDFPTMPETASDKIDDPDATDIKTAVVSVLLNLQSRGRGRPKGSANSRARRK